MHDFSRLADQRNVAAQANGVIDPALPTSPPPPRPRRSSYASYAQPVPPPPAADGDGGPVDEPLPYAGWASASISADGSTAAFLARRPSSAGHSPQTSSAASDATRMDSLGAKPGHGDAQHGGVIGLGGAWPAVSAPMPGYTRAGTALGKAGFQVRPPPTLQPFTNAACRDLL